MNVVMMIGDHPRHFHLAKLVSETGMLSGVIVERREQVGPKLPDGLDPALARLYAHHLAEHARIEEQCFGSAAKEFDGHRFGDVATLVTDLPGINGDSARRFISIRRPDLLLSFGVHKLTPETLSAAPKLRWNVHGGLSPWYRGTGTLFWPSYLLEPQMTGMTVHELTAAIDGGDIVHQCAAPLVHGDTLHQLSCRAVAALAGELPALLELSAGGGLRASVQQRSAGRIWRDSDWRPEHLRLIYETYADRVVDAYLDGKLAQRSPRLVRQWPPEPSLQR
jgi:methionyl-tRNA formyltransferase